MKPLFLLLTSILMLSTANIKAQITLEHVFDSTDLGKFYCTDIGNNDYKYVFLNEVKNNFSLYNMDMSPYMININIPVTSDSIVQGFGVIYITKSLFDCDSTNIEYVFENVYDVKHKFRVFRTDGTLLFQLDSANGPWALGGIYGGSYFFRPIQNTSSGAKLFLQKYDNNQVPEILVYSLCGKLPQTTNIYDFSSNQSFVKVFPNPASMELNFEVTIPNNQEEFQIVIFDSTTKEQKRKSMSVHQGKCSLNVSNYSSGTYMYSLVGNNKIYQSGKFFLTK